MNIMTVTAEYLRRGFVNSSCPLDKECWGTCYFEFHGLYNETESMEEETRYLQTRLLIMIDESKRNFSVKMLRVTFCSAEDVNLPPV